jgi:hypothetical protein
MMSRIGDMWCTKSSTTTRNHIPRSLSLRRAGVLFKPEATSMI